MTGLTEKRYGWGFDMEWWPIKALAALLSLMALQLAWDGFKKRQSGRQAAKAAVRVRHNKRGTTYVVLGEGKLQTDVPLHDNADLIAYRSEYDGRLWFRTPVEFDDPARFTVLPDTIDEEMARQEAMAVAIRRAEASGEIVKPFDPADPRPVKPHASGSGPMPYLHTPEDKA